MLSNPITSPYICLTFSTLSLSLCLNLKIEKSQMINPLAIWDLLVDNPF